MQRVLIIDGESAITWKPDLILSDWNMPRMDGGALLQQLQTSAALGTVPIVVMSAIPPTNGLAGVLEKPFSVRIDVGHD
jgi:CheY-like chemotaxis protein